MRLGAKRRWGVISATSQRGTLARRRPGGRHQRGVRSSSVPSRSCSLRRQRGGQGEYTMSGHRGAGESGRTCSICAFGPSLRLALAQRPDEAFEVFNRNQPSRSHLAHPVAVGICTADSPGGDVSGLPGPCKQDRQSMPIEVHRPMLVGGAGPKASTPCTRRPPVWTSTGLWPGPPAIGALARCVRRFPSG
jgi:hypothetical protein